MKVVKKSKKVTNKEKIKKLKQEAWKYFHFCNITPTKDDIDNFIESNGVIDLLPNAKRSKRNAK